MVKHTSSAAHSTNAFGEFSGFCNMWLRDVMPLHWINCSWCFEKIQRSWNIEVYPLTQHHTPKEQNTQDISCLTDIQVVLAVKKSNKCDITLWCTVPETTHTGDQRRSWSLGFPDRQTQLSVEPCGDTLIEQIHLLLVADSDQAGLCHHSFNKG
jgi:hypothetical protein